MASGSSALEPGRPGLSPALGSRQLQVHAHPPAAPPPTGYSRLTSSKKADRSSCASGRQLRVALKVVDVVGVQNAEQKAVLLIRQPMSRHAQTAGMRELG